MISGVLAGSIAGLCTNGVEILAVNKQTNSKFKVTQYIMQRKNWYRLMLQGVSFRTFYYGTQACLMFFLLEEFKIYLNCDQIED